jgi:hypothetical protein
VLGELLAPRAVLRRRQRGEERVELGQVVELLAVHLYAGLGTAQLAGEHGDARGVQASLGADGVDPLAQERYRGGFVAVARVDDPARADAPARGRGRRGGGGVGGANLEARAPAGGRAAGDTRVGSSRA